MRRMTIGLILAAVAAASAGCSVEAVPAQPKLTDVQIKELMRQGAVRREWGDPRGGMGPRKAKPRRPSR